MNQTVNTELNNLFNKLKTNGTERTKILAICAKIDDDATFLNEINASILPIIENKQFNLETHLTALIASIISVIKRVQFYKEVEDKERILCLIYSIIIASFLKFYPEKIKAVEIEKLRERFCDAMELVFILPETVKVEKSGCITCVAESIKMFQFINKNKILI